MPPIEPSLRGSLLTGASALALSVSASAAHAQAIPPPSALPPWTVWIEAAGFWTEGGSYNIPSLPGLGAPFTQFSPLPAVEGAVGLDYRWPDPVWHFVFDFRYGVTKSNGANSSFFQSFITHSVPGEVKTIAGATSASEREGHWVADFMIGRDLGIGANRPELLFGVRVADLWATAQFSETGKRTIYSGTAAGLVTTANSASGSWNSRFFGAGPRLGVTGAVEIIGFWTFDYGAGVAALFGDRSFNVSVTTTPGGSYSASSNPLVFVFNADAWVALSYQFTPYAKLTGGIRFDFYDSALTTYNVNTGALQNLDRLFWGPFLRLTTQF
jgi:hypothetical protein